MIVFIGGLILVAAFSWYLVFSDRARQRYNAANWRFWNRSKEGRALDNDLTLATSLIAAVFCTTLLVAIVIIGILEMFK